VPALADVLEAVAIPLNVELKPCGDDGLEARTLAMVRAAGALPRVVFSSFDGASLDRVARQAPDAAVAILWETKDIDDALRRAARVGARALHLRNDVVGPETIAAAAAAGLPVRVWTVNDPGEMARLVNVGIDAVFTDYPERFLHLRGRA
jgi:glycerophosphoryl diester phosphodiesterase